MNSPHPLVSYTLFAYKQEQYVRAAVESALAQTYSPLEIIISDDCSPDRTFEIIEECFAAYSGPHKVILNRNECNLGLAKHVNKLFSIAKGKIVVFAAGDDVSLPERVEIITKVFASTSTNTMLVYSNGWTTDENGIRNGEIGECMTVKYPYNIKKLLLNLQFVVGATVACRRELIDRFGPLAETTTNEDNALLYRAFLIGEIIYCDQRLVEWRRIPSSLSAEENNLAKFKVRTYLWYESMYRQIAHDCKAIGIKDESIIKMSERLAERSACLRKIWENPVSFFQTFQWAVAFQSLLIIKEALKSKLYKNC